MSSDTNPQPRKVVAVNGPVNAQGNIINTQTGGVVPNQQLAGAGTQPQGTTNQQQQPPKQQGGGPEGPAVQDTAALANSVNPNLNAPSGQSNQDPNNIDIDKFIADSTTEVKVFDEK